MTTKYLAPVGALSLMALVACTAYSGTPSGEYSSSSSEGFVWASSYSSSSSSQSFTGEGCKIGGCSNHVCVSADAEDVITTCEYRDAYACYTNARCEKQDNGSCGWTQTDELKSCLADPPKST